MTSRPKILVTSAAGRVGLETVRELCKSGADVRAFVHRQDQRSSALSALGAEVFVGNLFDYRDVSRAMSDVQRVFHCPPFAQNQLHTTTLICLAAQEARVETLVLLSAWNPHPAHPSSVSREHWIANNIAQWMPNVDLVFVNPGIFAFTYLLSLPVTAKLGLLPLSFDNELNAPISERDIARVAAKICQNPAPHIGKTYRPTGPKLLTPSDVAQSIEKVVKRKITHRNVPFSMTAKAAKALGFSTFDTANLAYYAEEIRAGAFAIGAPTDHVQTVTGQPAESFEDTVRFYHQNPDRLAPGLRHLSTFGAIRFMARMMITRAPNLEKFRISRGLPQLSNPKLAHEEDAWCESAKAGHLHLLNQHTVIGQKVANR